MLSSKLFTDAAWPFRSSRDWRFQTASMYIPEHFRVREHEKAITFMQANPFAILVSQTPDGPFATHLPLAIYQEGEQVILRGHVGKANPHWQHLESQPQALVIFHGPHAYISPSNYVTRENVPTWNYGAVHGYGNARVFATHEELLRMLDGLISTFERSYAVQWSEMSQAYRERMLGHIVGFEIVVSRLEAKFKLSQNRTKQEQENVIASLSGSTDTAISGTAGLMREQGLGEADSPGPQESQPGKKPE
jgi:transcriptional regulator